MTRDEGVQLLQRYKSWGWRLVYFPAGTKGPNEKGSRGWINADDKPEDWNPAKHNVGVFVGAEVQPGKFLVDIDFDWADGMVLAKRLLPPAQFGFGRTSRLVTHAFYYAATSLASRFFDDIDGKRIVEFRATKADGGVGLETMVPPSTHPSGEALEIRVNEEPTIAPTIDRDVVLYAVGCIILRHIGLKGLVHDARLSLAGLLLNSGCSEEEAVRVCVAVAEATGNDIADAETATRTTANTLRQGGKAKGGPSLARMIGDHGPNVLRLVKRLLGAGEFAVDDKGRPIKDSQENVRIALMKVGAELSFDEFSGKPMCRIGEGPLESVDDRIRNRLWLEIDTQFRFRPPADFFDVVLSDEASSRPYHPVRDWLDSLSWDQEPRLDGWLTKYGGAASSAYSVAVGSIVLIAAVRRVRTPGAKLDEILILESSQGKNKSSALRALCKDDAWFGDDLPLNVDAKQIIERTMGKWIIEAADLAGMAPAKVESLKAMLSRQYDGPVRMAYARMPVERPRHFIVVGTTNTHAYLKDVTGNRRFWPVRVGEFDLESLRRDRDQLWAEAAHRERMGESIRLPRALWGFAELQQERRRAEDAWESILDMAFDPGERLRLPPTDIWKSLGIPVERRDAKASERIAAIMQKLGFRRGTVRDESGRPVKGWMRDPFSPEGLALTDPHGEE